MLELTFVSLSISCEASSHVRSSLAQVVAIVAQVSPTDALLLFEIAGVGFETFVIDII
jgi:hypothetical protein